MVRHAFEFGHTLLNVDSITYADFEAYLVECANQPDHASQKKELIVTLTGDVARSAIQNRFVPVGSHSSCFGLWIRGSIKVASR